MVRSKMKRNMIVGFERPVSYKGSCRRKTDRQTERQTDRQTDRQTETETETETDALTL